MTSKKKISFKCRIFRWSKVIIIIYCSLGITGYYLQEKILLHPEPLDASYHYAFNVPFDEVNIKMNEGENLNIVRFFPSESAKGVVLYFHGNMKNVNHYAKFAALFTSRGYEVWMPDYPGFGKTTGVLTEKKLYREAAEVFKLANSKYKADSIVIYGKSFGTGIASWLAADVDCKKLILEAPYYSIPSLFSCYAPVYPTEAMSTLKLPSGKYLQDVFVSITIFHGDDDEVIPFRCAAKLKKVLKPTDEFVTIYDGRHNNLAEFDVFKRKLDSLLN